MPRPNRREFIAGACGAAASGTVAAIFGGRVLDATVYPYALRFDTGYGAYSGRCGATHIGNGVCVSAAHCGVDEGVTSFAFNGRRVAKINGTYYVFAPNSYNREGLDDDSLYIFDPNLVGAPFIDVPTLAMYADFRKRVASGQSVKALSVGYGTTRLDENGRPTDVSDELKGLDVAIESATRRKIVVKDPTDTGGVCVGDSGSGLFHQERIFGATSSVVFNPATGSYCDRPGYTATYRSFERELDVIASLKAGLAEFVA